jgi:hypothetical protein
MHSFQIVNKNVRFDVSHQRKNVLNFVTKLFSKSCFLFVMHFFLFLGISYLAFLIRFDLNFRSEIKFYYCGQAICFIVCTKLLVFYFNNHFREAWYYATTRNLQQLIFSTGMALILNLRRQIAFGN